MSAKDDIRHFCRYNVEIRNDNGSLAATVDLLSWPEPGKAVGALLAHITQGMRRYS
jgi:hypothetical protein